MCSQHIHRPAQTGANHSDNIALLNIQTPNQIKAKKKK
jgi:hypothetical protein